MMPRISKGLQGGALSFLLGLGVVCLGSCSIWRPISSASIKLDEVDGDSRDRLVYLEAEISRLEAEEKYTIVPSADEAAEKFAVRRRAWSEDYEIKVLGKWNRCDGGLMKRTTDWLSAEEGSSFFIEAWVLQEGARDGNAGRVVAIALDYGPLFFDGVRR